MTSQSVVATYQHDPDATLDYVLAWGTWLGTDTIVSVAWTVPTGLTLESSSATTTTATAWISGGTADEDYVVGCRITTTAGRVDERSIRLKVRER